MMNQQQFCMNCMTDKGAQVICPSCGIDDRQIPPEPHTLPFRSMLNGKYLVGRVLGSGGFGNTYLVLDTLLQQKLAIKEFLPRDFATRSPQQTDVLVYSGERSDHFRQGMDKFLDEARTLAKFNSHPGIVSIRDFFYQNNTAYIVMEYVEGITLKQYLKQKGGRLPAELVLEIMRPVIDALRTVHEVGILHRDVSPDNIYITADRQVKLLDFGAARQAVSEASKSLSVILKPGYAPEEQYRMRGKQGPWTDVYAVAATMYHCMSGVLPPDSLDRFDEDELQPLERLVSGVPKSVNDAVMRGLALRAAERWQTIREFLQALELQSEAQRGEQQVTKVEPAMAESPEKTVPLYFKPSTKPDVQTGASERRNDSGQHSGAVNTQTSPMMKQKSKLMVMWLTVIGTLVIAIVIVVAMFAGSGSQDAEPPVEDESVVGTPTNPLDDTLKLQIGDYVQFGKYYDKPIKWRVINEDSEDNPVLFSDKILTLKAFDAAGSYHSDSVRSLNGSNNYENSNLRQWLNNDETSIDWKQNSPNSMNLWDGNNPYAFENGFLADGNFTSQERSLIKSFNHRVLLSNLDLDRSMNGSEMHEMKIETPDAALANYDNASYTTVSDKVFLLSVKQLTEWVYDQRLILGESWFIGEPTEDALINSTYRPEDLITDEKWYYWLNTPQSAEPGKVRYVHRSGKINSYLAFGGGIGVRPALQLNLSLADFAANGDGTETKPYVVQAE